MMMSQNFNRRFSPNRRKTCVEARIHVDGATLPATILDISYEGMKLSVGGDFPKGTPLSVEIGTSLIPAIVHWNDPPHAGLHLLERLDSDTLILLENAADDLAAFR